MARRKSLFSGIKGGRNNITKKDIVDYTAGRTKLTKKDTKTTIDAFLDVVKKVTEAGGYITLAGFGTFKVVKRKASTRKTTAKQRKMLGIKKTTIRVPASERLAFSPSKK